MYKLKIAYQEQDLEFEKAIKNMFPEYQNLVREKDFDGLNLFITIVIPVTTLTTEILDFLITHLVKRKKDDENDKSEPKRALVTKEGFLYLEGYSKKDVKEIIEVYLYDKA